MLSVDENTAAIIGSAELIESQLRQIQSSGEKIDNHLLEIGSSLQKGIDSVDFRLSQIDQKMDEMVGICATGFHNIQSAILRSNELLGELVTTMKTPDQTWAREQYMAAQHCIDNGLWDEALEYCDKAIFGDSRHSGYKIEPTFHFLRGIIHMGGLGQTVPRHFDLDAAVDDFKLASKYCGKGNRRLKALALTHAGWAAYCSGNPLAAIDYLVAASSWHYKRGEPLFLEAKVRLYLGQIEKAEKPFCQALNLNPVYGIRAANDPDFVEHWKTVEKWMLRVSRDQFKKLKSKASKILDSFEHENLVEIAEKYDLDGEINDNIFSKITKSRKPYALTRTVNLLSIFPHHESRQVSIYENVANKIGERVEKVNIPERKVIDNTEMKTNNGAILGVFGAGLLSLAIVYGEYESSRDSFISMFFLFLFLMIIFCIPGVPAGMYFGKASGKKDYRNRMLDSSYQRNIKINAINQKNEPILRDVRKFRRLYGA